MKNLRKAILMLAVAAVSLTAQYSFAQQEVDPDHYDQPIVAKSAVKAPAHKSTTQKQNSGKTNVASHRAKQHSTKPAA